MLLNYYFSHLFLSVFTRNQYTLGITLLSLSLSLPYRLFIRIWRNTISVLIDQYMQLFKMKWSRISNLLNLVIYRLHPFRGSNINFLCVHSLNGFELTHLQIKLGKRLYPNCQIKNHMKCLLIHQNLIMTSMHRHLL